VILSWAYNVYVKRQRNCVYRLVLLKQNGACKMRVTEVSVDWGVFRVAVYEISQRVLVVPTNIHSLKCLL